MNPTTDFSIRSYLGGYDNNFTYIVTCSHTRFQLIVDASVPLKNLRKHILSPPAALLITHSHGDHTAFVEPYLEAFPDMAVVCFPASSHQYDANQILPIAHNQTIKVGQLTIHGIHTPGHYFDSVCFRIDNILFSGDTLFVGRTGRVKSTKSDIEDLYNSVYKNLLTLPGNTRIYSGHDYGTKPTITIDENIKLSPLLQASDLVDFKLRMDEYENTRLSES